MHDESIRSGPTPGHLRCVGQRTAAGSGDCVQEKVRPGRGPLGPCDSAPLLRSEKTSPKAAQLPASLLIWGNAQSRAVEDSGDSEDRETHTARSQAKAHRGCVGMQVSCP